MEPVGLVVGIAGLAGLFSACLDVIDKVDSYNDFGVDSRSILAQFEADKLLFKTWARSVGISKDELEDIHHHYLDSPETILVVQKILSSIQEIFSKTDITVSKLMPKRETNTGFSQSPTSLPWGHSNPMVGSSISRRDRIGWALRSKAKFITQAQQFGALVERLQGLVPHGETTGLMHMQMGTTGTDLGSWSDRATWLSNSQRILMEMEKQLERETREELYIWLDSSWTNDLYDKYLRRKLDNTCDWILFRPQFLDWMSPDFPSMAPKVLWINAPAGYGKTILCARVVHHLSTTLDSPPAYYFCSSESGSSRDPSAIMRSWISQMISSDKNAFELACGRWESKDGRHASRTDIIELFKAIIQQSRKCTFVADGLDECAWPEDDSPTVFLESMRQAVADTTTRIMLLSRDEPDIRFGFHTVLAGLGGQSFSEYKITPEDVRPDAVSFSRSIVDKKLAGKSETLKDELSLRMVDRCDGMFLWVKMLEDQLRSWKNKEQLKDTIDQAPTALDRLYDRNWMKISQLPDANQRMRAFSILRWVAFALRPLTIFEITEALLIVDDESCDNLRTGDLPDEINEDYINTEILSLCGPLVERQKAASNQDLGSTTLHLAHFSVKQYILCNMPSQDGLLALNERLRYSNELIQHNVLAKMCLRYLDCQQVWQELASGHNCSPQIGTFRDYAAGLWYQHLKSNASNYAEVLTRINSFFKTDNANWESWRKWFDRVGEKSTTEITSANPLFYASLLGLQDTVIYLTEEVRLEVDQMDGFNRTALQAASSKGHVSITQLLLEKGANITTADNYGCTALYLASKKGHLEIIKLLLDKGADITVVNGAGWTPLYTASNNGHVEVVKLLLKKGADITVTNSNGWTPLNSASDRGHVKVVELLLKNGADITIGNSNGWTPLNSASNNGHSEVVELLLKEGADTTIANSDGRTPLNVASNNGHIEVVKLLLKKRADISIASSNGWTPLNSASESGHSKVVELLLKEGADITVASSKGWTPLTAASINGHPEVVELLLKEGADTTIANDDGWTPLNLASNNGHIEVVKLLLKKGADISVAGSNGWTPLNSASDSGHSEVVELLLKEGVDVTVANSNGWTPLNSASKNGHFEVVRLLLKEGADIKVTTNDGWTPLNSASYYGHSKVVRLLLEGGANITVVNNDGCTALYSASRKGHLEIVKLLLNRGADVTAANSNGWTPLNLASTNGHSEVVRLLLDTGKVDLDSRDTKYGRTALCHAAMSGFEAVAKLLLVERFSDPNLKDNIGRTPLAYAAKNGHDKVVETLLASNRITQDSKDHYGSTPLSLAARKGHPLVVKLLLATGCVDPDSQDSFGRTPLWWVGRHGNHHIAQLLVENAKNRGVSIREFKSTVQTSPLADDEGSRLCDVCILSISLGSVYYRCGLCNGGDFDICLECFTTGFHCLEESHQLAEKKDIEVPR